MTRDEIVEAIKKTAKAVGRVPSKREFHAQSGISEYKATNHFASWNEAVQAAGLDPNLSNVRIEDEQLLKDWAAVVRILRRIPTVVQFRRHGKHNHRVLEKRFGPWSVMPNKFRELFGSNREYADVIALLPAPTDRADAGVPTATVNSEPLVTHRHARPDSRPTYGNPLGFRGLRHEPVNEQGVVFLFGMVAHELGYLVEAVQEGFPDCEAKRQIGPGKWPRVRIEFEYESRTFRDHGHAVDGCDIVVCWRHNWPECPPHLEVVELSSVIKSLPKSEE
ncbi:MAG: hypothetical protein HY716_01360 [Planctomycetes bacterium]|nr:hypothetical protein [Planctomycetota bacterium]